MRIETVDGAGRPVCPVDQTPVAREGEICSPVCWIHLHIVIHETGDLVNEMSYLDITEQPWYLEGIDGG